MKKSQHRLANDIVEGLNQSIGAMSVLIHMRSDYRYSIMRESLQLVKDCIVAKITCDASKTIITKVN